MQTRTITVDHDRPRGYELGYSGENNIIKLVLPVPPELSNADCYRVYFETTTGESRQTDIEQAVEGAVTVTLTADLAPEPGTVVAQLVAFADGDIIGKAPVIYGTVKQSISEGTELDGHTIAAEVTANTLARHTHANKTVLDKLGEGDGSLTYDGKPIGGGTSTDELIVNVNLTDTDSLNPTVTADKTHEELSAAYETGAKLSACVDFDGEATAVIPFLYLADNTYCFAASLNPGTAVVLYCTADGWTYDNPCIDAGDIVYGDTTLLFELNRLNNEVNANTKDRHTHSNKAVLDSLSTADGKLKYNGSDVGLKGDKGDKGTDGKTPVKGVDYWTTADQESIVNDVLAALPDGDEVSY